MGSVDKILAMLGESRVFTKLDVNSGFWQIPLDEESKLLTTFITPFGPFILHTQDNGQCLPICFISRSLSVAEGCYAVMEKEVLTSTWACKHLEEYPVLLWTQVKPRNKSKATCSTPHNNQLVQGAPSNTALTHTNDAIQP